MIRCKGSYRTEIREKMRGGSGSVIIEHLWEKETELKSPTRMFAKLTLNPGCSIGLHRHDGEEEIFVILKGQGEVDDDGVKVPVGPGDAVLTGDAGHAISSTGGEPLEFIAVIAKRR